MYARSRVTVNGQPIGESIGVGDACGVCQGRARQTVAPKHRDQRIVDNRCRRVCRPVALRFGQVGHTIGCPMDRRDCRYHSIPKPIGKGIAEYHFIPKA